MSVIEHIKLRHWFNTTYVNVSKFTPGTSSATISNYIRLALKFGKRDGNAIRYNVGKIIGTGSDGVQTSDIMIYMRDGFPSTAFPVH